MTPSADHTSRPAATVPADRLAHLGLSSHDDPDPPPRVAGGADNQPGTVRDEDDQAGDEAVAAALVAVERGSRSVRVRKSDETKVQSAAMEAHLCPTCRCP